MLDLAHMRAELARHYDLAPSLKLAEQTSDIWQKMSRVVSFPDWAIHAPYVAAINRLKA
jgi:quinolinate synthase